MVNGPRVDLKFRARRNQDPPGPVPTPPILCEYRAEKGSFQTESPLAQLPPLVQLLHLGRSNNLTSVPEQSTDSKISSSLMAITLWIVSPGLDSSKTASSLPSAITGEQH